MKTLNKSEKRMKTILGVLRVLEVLYLLTFFIIMSASKLPAAEVEHFTRVWLTISYMLLPVLLLKNIIVGVYENKFLEPKHKFWLIVRCVIYILLAVYSYPLIQALGICY